MITLNPLPKFSQLFKSALLTQKKINNDEPWISQTKSSQFWFSRSTFAMLTIIKWFKEFSGNSKPVIWLPDYFCNEPLEFLKNFEITFTFYPITDNLNPNWEECESLAKTKKPDIFFLVHYFGKCNDLKNAKSFCDDFNCIFVEDAAHVIQPYADIGKNSDFIFFSQHKLFAIPDGSLLILNLNSKRIKQISEKKSIDAINKVIESYPKTSPSYLKWLLKRCLQNFLPDYLWLNKKKINKSTNINFSPFQSFFSKRLLSIQKNYISDYVKLRRKNDASLKIGFNSESQIENDFTPYMTMIQFNSSDQAKKCYDQKKSPLMIWPDLHPKILNQSYNNKIPIELKDTRMFFPVHQSINTNSLRRMRKILNNNKVENYLELNISYSIINKEDLDNYINEVNFSNYLQLGSYGVAKNEVQGWKVERLLIKSNNKPVAICQILIKVVMGIKICRINRGPLFLSNKSSNIKLNVLQFLKSKYNLRSRSILIINPELTNSYENYAIMDLLNFKLVSKKIWKSSYLELKISAEELRKNLNGKWRNQLKKAESYDLIIEHDNKNSSFRWLMNEYDKLMIDKSFNGPSVDLYRTLYNNDRNALTIFKAIHEGKPVAGQMYIKHGNTSTYLVGWNSISGRKMYLHNWLIWNAILLMKSKNISYFDLGGVDKVNTPGIAKFKLGVKGRNFSLVGDWVSW